MCNNLQEICQSLRQLLPIITERYQVKTIGIFGSFVRQEQRADSDLDLLVTFVEPPSLLRFIELENYLSDQLGVHVDLVMQDALKPALGSQILREAVPV